MRNTFGNIFQLTTFGESHGPALGGIIDGMPAGISVDTDLLNSELARRRPGQSSITTARAEADEVEILSGTFEGKTTGCPIGFIIRNTDHHSSDYDDLRQLFRPSHADFTYQQKYGIRDHRGGGRSSARETAARIVGGAFAKMALRQLGISVQAYTSAVGTISLDTPYTRLDLSQAENNPVRCPDPDTAERMLQLITDVKKEGDTIGGMVTCIVRGCPAGLGEPVFGKLQSALGAALLSINAAKSFEVGDGIEGCRHRGSEQNDIFCTADHRISTRTNHSGGIQGGISNGADICLRVGFKPVATLLRSQPTVTLDGQPISFAAHGRHDPCVLPRAVPIVEAMTAMTILDYYLLNQTTHIL